jgi:hypothetical protein
VRGLDALPLALQDVAHNLLAGVAGRIFDLQPDHRHHIGRAIGDVADKLLGHASSSAVSIQERNIVTSMMVPPMKKIIDSLANK